MNSYEDIQRQGDRLTDNITKDPIQLKIRVKQDKVYNGPRDILFNKN